MSFIVSLLCLAIRFSLASSSRLSRTVIRRHLLAPWASLQSLALWQSMDLDRSIQKSAPERLRWPGIPSHPSDARSRTHKKNRNKGRGGGGEALFSFLPPVRPSRAPAFPPSTSSSHTHDRCQYSANSLCIALFSVPTLVSVDFSHLFPVRRQERRARFLKSALLLLLRWKFK